MQIKKESLVYQSQAIIAVKIALEENKDFTIYALPVSDTLDSSLGWYLSFSGLDFFGRDKEDAFLCNAKNNVRVFKSLDSLFKVAQDNFTGLVTVCCV